MIIETGFALNGPWGLLALMAMAVAMLVNRAGASMVFFDVVGRFQAQRLIKDADTSMTVFNSIMLDTFANMQDSLNVVGTSIEGLVTSVLPFTEAMEDAEIELRKFLDASEDIDQIADGRPSPKRSRKDGAVGFCIRAGTDRGRYAVRYGVWSDKRHGNRIRNAATH